MAKGDFVFSSTNIANQTTQNGRKFSSWESLARKRHTVYWNHISPTLHRYFSRNTYMRRYTCAPTSCEKEKQRWRAQKYTTTTNTNTTKSAAQKNLACSSNLSNVKCHWDQVRSLSFNRTKTARLLGTSTEPTHKKLNAWQQQAELTYCTNCCPKKGILLKILSNAQAAKSYYDSFLQIGKNVFFKTFGTKTVGAVCIHGRSVANRPNSFSVRNEIPRHRLVHFQRFSADSLV